MKKILMIATAASAFIAAPAFAQSGGPNPWQGQQYSDQFVQYRLTATGQSFCRFGATGNSANPGTNATDGGFHSAGVNPGGDAWFVFDIQNDNDNTVQAADATFNFQRFVCNSPYQVTAVSQNGGLDATATTDDADFNQLISYNIQVTMDGIAGTNTAITTGNRTPTLFTRTAALAGPASVRIAVPASDTLVLQGAYEDIITLTMSPTA